jgi:hypothetical protein
VPEGEDLVKSTYCSLLRFADDPDREVEYENEIRKMSMDVQAGRGIVYDDDDLERLREMIGFLEGGSKGVLGALFRLLLPAMVFFAILYLIVKLLEFWLP